MRGFVWFVFGIVTGATAVLAYERVRELQTDPDRLEERVEGHLDELESRLDYEDA